MLELQNSCERELDDWAALLPRADTEFKFLGGQQPEGSNLWILTARGKVVTETFEEVMRDAKSRE